MTLQTPCCTETTSTCRCGCGSDAGTVEGFVATSRFNTLTFSAAQCINCGMCTIVCPHGVFASGDTIVQIAHADLCMECGACQLNCPAGALQVDSGVGCAAAMINAALRGLDEPTCGCDEEAGCGACC